MKLSTEDIIELLETYKEYESLYNTQHPKHGDKNCRRAALKQMLLELREKGESRGCLELHYVYPIPFNISNRKFQEFTFRT